MGLKKALLMTLTLGMSAAISQPIRLSDFLSTVREDYNLEKQTEKIEFLENSKPGLPFTDKVELRVEDAAPFSKRWKLYERMRYSLRIRPSGVREAFAVRKVHNSTLKHNIHKRDMRLNKLLRQRYMLAFELMYRNAVVVRVGELITLYEDFTHIYDRKVNEADFDFNSLIDSEDELTELRLDFVEQKNLVHALEQRVKAILPDVQSVEFDTTGLLDINRVNKIMSSTPIVMDSANIHLRKNLLKLREAEAKYRHETVSGREYINHIELGFDSDHFFDEKQRKADGKEYDISKAYNFEIGFTIPAINTDQLNINRRRMKIMDEMGDFNQLKEELVQEVAVLNREIQTLVQQYNLLMERRSSIRKKSSLDKYMRIDGEDPLVLLRLKESVIESEIQMEKIKFDIYKKFIRKMDLSGNLSGKPLRNKVSAKQELLK
ncbi:MAG: hypothetical protein ACLFQB_10445 [Chitinispirillaceae bacterium]